MTHTALIEQETKKLDKKLERLFNLGGLALVAFLKNEITKEERTALLDEWNIEAFGYYRTFASAIHENDREEFRGIIGDMEDDMGTAVDPKGKKIKLFDAVAEARNDFRSELTTKLDNWK